MKKFRTSFLNGYSRKDVDEYVEFLVNELDSLKEETARMLEEQKQKMSELELRITQEQEEKEKLLKKVHDSEEQANQKNIEREEKVRNMEEKLRKYEESCEAVPRVMAMAQTDAEKIVSAAKTNAGQILSDARENAKRMSEEADKEVFALRKKTEEELQARKEIEERNYMAAKYKLKEYLDSLNATQSRLISTYNELGKLVNQMPIRLEDVFSEESMELLENQSAVKKKKIDISISEAGEE